MKYAQLRRKIKKQVQLSTLGIWFHDIDNSDPDTLKLTMHFNYSKGSNDEQSI